MMLIHNVNDYQMICPHCLRLLEDIEDCQERRPLVKGHVEQVLEDLKEI